MSNFKDNSGLEHLKPKMSKEERDRLMKEFLENRIKRKILECVRNLVYLMIILFIT